jgi:hypothetical protein
LIPKHFEDLSLNTALKTSAGGGEREMSHYYIFCHVPRQTASFVSIQAVSTKSYYQSKIKSALASVHKRKRKQHKQIAPIKNNAFTREMHIEIGFFVTKRGFTELDSYVKLVTVITSLGRIVITPFTDITSMIMKVT